MFYSTILLVFILNQVDFRNALECSPTAYSKRPCNITREVPLNQGTLVWRKDGAFLRDTSFPCTDFLSDQNYSGYCFDNSSTRIYILEILKPEYQDLSMFTDSVTSDETTLDLMVPDDLSVTSQIPDEINGSTFFVSAIIDCCKPEPKFKLRLTVLDSDKTYVFELSTMSSDNSCSPRLLKWNSSLTVDLNALDPPISEQNKEINITIDVQFGCCKIFSSVPVTVTRIGSTSSSSAITHENLPSTTVGSSSPPTLSSSTPIQTTSSTQNYSINVTSEPSTSTAHTPQCDNLICECDTICIIIIISVCVGSLIFVVVIIICCCCCSFCPCYKRNKENRDGTECKCCLLICGCCKRNNKNDDESEGRQRVCECCYCPFCLCFKSNKKPSGRKHNQNATKNQSRSQQYEMNRTNRPNEMHPGSNYHIRRPDQRTRAYQPASATQFAHPKEYYYGQGYNNVAFVYYRESERRRDMDRKPRVNQRPFTNYY